MNSGFQNWLTRSPTLLSFFWIFCLVVSVSIAWSLGPLFLELALGWQIGLVSLLLCLLWLARWVRDIGYVQQPEIKNEDGKTSVAYANAGD
jgi:hypothetical protein